MAFQLLRHQQHQGISQMLAKLLAFFLALGSVGCATMGVENVRELAPEHRIMVVSVLGDQLTLRHYGTTVFQCCFNTEDVADWQIDEGVEAAVREQLARAGKSVVVPDDPEILRNKLGDVDWGSLTGVLEVEGGTGVLLEAAQAHGADSVLLVGSATLSDMFYGDRLGVRGYGIYQRSFLFLKDAINYALVSLWLVDGETGEEIARTSKWDSTPRAESEWIEKMDEGLPEDTRQRTREEIERLIHAALAKALKEFFSE